MPIDHTNLFDLFTERVEVASNGIPITAEVRFYLTAVLMEWVRSDRSTYSEDTMAELFLRADAAHINRKAAIYRELGDRSLILIGVFKPSVERKIVSTSYYVDMGSAAYYRTHLWYNAAFGEVFKDMATQFENCAAVIEGSMGL